MHTIINNPLFQSTHGTYINNIRVHRKIAKLYDNDEIIFAQDHHNTKFTLCRASYSIDENEVVHVMDDSESEGKFGDEHNSPSTSTSGTNKTNTNARPEPSSETVIWVSSDSDSLTLSDSSHNSILPITLKSIPGNSSGKTPITTSGAAPEIYMENHSVLSGSVSGDEPIVGTDTELVRFDAIPALHPPVVISVYHNYINEFHGTERFNPSPPVLLRNLLIIQACMASMAESVNLALDVIRAEVVAAENEVPSDTENSNDKSYGFDLFAISDCENEEVVEKNEDLNDFCEEILDEESKSGEDDVGRQEEENKNFIEQSCIDGKHEDLDKKMSSQDVVA